MEPATKTCPTCRATSLLYATVCDICDRPFPAQTLPEEDPVSATPRESGPLAGLLPLCKKHAQRGICLLGALMGITGVFMPILSGPWGYLVYMKMSVRIVLIVLSLIVTGGTFCRKFLRVAFIGSAMLTYHSMMLISRLRFPRTPSGVSERGTLLLHLQCGWFFIILAAVVMILGGAYDIISLPSDPEDRIVVERKRKRFLLSCLAAMGTTVLLVVFLHTLGVRKSAQTARQSASSTVPPLTRPL